MGECDRVCDGDGAQFEQCLDSMSKLAQFVLYDSSTDLKCLFDLSECDKKDIDYYAKEIDSIQSELSDINDRIAQIRNSYKSYNEDFLRLCDDKDVLFELFLDYYEEYFLEPINPSKDLPTPDSMTRNNRNRKKSTSNNNNSNSGKTARRKRSRSVSVSRRATSVSKSSQPVVKMRTTVVDENNSGDEDTLSALDESKSHGNKRLQLRRRSSIYIYSVPTENRFSILSRTEDGNTLLKHY